MKLSSWGLALLLCGSALPAKAQFITGLYNTGVTNARTIATEGSTDIHYTLASSSVPAYDGGRPAYVTTSTPGVWTGNTTLAHWIAPEAAQASAVYTNGDYTYRTTFTLTGATPSLARLQLRLAADDSVSVFLNNTQVLTNVGGYQNLSTHTVSTGFISGTNTLDFRVHQTGAGPSAVLVEATALVAPEAGTLCLLLPLLPMGALVWRRQERRPRRVSIVSAPNLNECA